MVDADLGRLRNSVASRRMRLVTSIPDLRDIMGRRLETKREKASRYRRLTPRRSTFRASPRDRFSKNGAVNWSLSSSSIDLGAPSRFPPTAVGSQLPKYRKNKHK
jgi:hypothetical protein